MKQFHSPFRNWGTWYLHCHGAGWFVMILEDYHQNKSSTICQFFRLLVCFVCCCWSFFGCLFDLVSNITINSEFNNVGWIEINATLQNSTLFNHVLCGKTSSSSVICIVSCEWCLNRLADTINVTGHHAFVAATRETALLHAISTAAITHEITLQCRQNKIPGCQCVEIKNKQPKGNGDWQWGGCSDNIWFGENTTRSFIDELESQVGNARRAVNLHNNEVGRRVNVFFSCSVKFFTHCNDALFGDWHRYTRKKEIGVEPETFRFLVQML